MLQVLLWTTCLLSSCAAASARPEDAGYIIRETVRPALCAVVGSSPKGTVVSVGVVTRHGLLSDDTFIAASTF